ncbi:MAG: OmpA family protein [Bryobacteraceae bacterium]|nr:OmpA family protein [Bryobacteraceae bacterium]
MWKAQLLIFFGWGGLAGAQVSEATRYFEEARATTDTSRKIELLKKSIAAGNSFAAHYALGEAYRIKHDLQLSEESFLRALDTAADAKEMARAAYRLGQVADQQGKSADAIAWMTTSVKYHSYPEVEANLKALEIRQMGQSASANEIVSALTSLSRSARVTPAVSIRIHFDLNSAELTAEGRRQADELAKALSVESLQGQRVKLIGHTDIRGGEDLNMDLSRRRAAAVAAYLNGKAKFSRGRVLTEGKGAHDLLFPGNEEEDHRLNRRVEVQLAR